jgi:lysophospholipase L1-like esterase
MRYEQSQDRKRPYRMSPKLFLVTLLCLLTGAIGCNASQGATSGAVRVAAVGDSITFGGGRDDAYPAQLAKLLGDRYNVANFGVPGATALNRGDFPYVQQPAYRAARAYAPDIVIVMLGTNDTKAHNWPHRGTFSADLTRLVSAFRDLPTRPQILLTLPPPVFQRDTPNIDGGRLQALLPMIRTVAAQLHAPLLDLQRAFADKPSLLPDHIHPNAEGNALIAREVRDALVRELGMSHRR